MQYVQKRGGPGRDDGDSSAAPADDATAKSLPALWEFVTAGKWDDGTPRETGTIFLFVEEGSWKACLNDRDGGLVAFVAKPTLKAVLDAANRGLVEDRLDWRRSRGVGRKGKRG